MPFTFIKPATKTKCSQLEMAIYCKMCTVWNTPTIRRSIMWCKQLWYNSQSHSHETWTINNKIKIMNIWDGINIK